MIAIHRHHDGALLAICPEEKAADLAESFACETFSVTATDAQARALLREAKSMQRAVRLEAIETGRVAA